MSPHAGTAIVRLLGPGPFALLLVATSAAIGTPSVSADSSATGSIHGRAFAAGRPQAFARVNVLGTSRQTLSDDRGQYRLTLVPAGTQRLGLSVVGYKRTLTSVRVEAGRDAAVDLFAGPGDLGRNTMEVPPHGRRTHLVRNCEDTPDRPALPDTTGWWSASGSIFDFSLPTEFRRTPGRGIDSEAGEWRSDSAYIGYDLGGFSGSGEPLNPGPEYRSECLDGFHAWIRLGNRGLRTRVVVGVPSLNLVLFGEASDAAEQARILAAFRTIRFHDPGATRHVAAPPAPLLPRVDSESKGSDAPHAHR